ncbi:YeiH family protein [Onishia niordana]|uniref:YeiH family protein n=1 Tax=Onishia niordana TaxID=2508711 RepID=UPI00109FAC9E|nr:YeiH family protein [Halomonas niordiana]
MWQGLLLCALVSLAGIAAAALPGLADSGVSPLVFALLMGLVLGNIPLDRLPGHLSRLPFLEGAGPGLAFATRWLLRGGIVLFGLSLTLEQVIALGPRILLLDLLVISSVLVIGYQLGTRWLGLDRETALLTSAGSAICGAAAVLATETTIRARPAATAMAVATVVLFGTLAMLVYPLLYPLTGMPEGLFGIYIGATVHEVAQVVAAGDAIGPDALANAVIVKLVRVMMLVPFLLIVGRWWLSRTAEDGGENAGRPARGMTIPWFAFGFVGMVIFNSLVTLPAALYQGLVVTGQMALTMAMAALGLNTRLASLKALGVKPLILALCLFTLLVLGGGLASLALMG